MNEITGWFYLHVNKELIFKSYADAISDIRESDLCESAWAWDGTRKQAWNILIESLSLGAKKERVLGLADKWKCTDDDAKNYAMSVNVLLGEDGTAKTASRPDFVNVAEDICGFGDTYLEAMADLCRQMGFSGGKIWQQTFEGLLLL